MPAAERVLARAARLAERHARQLGDEILERRLTLGQSQDEVGRTSHMSRVRLRRIETGMATNLRLEELHRVCAVLGLSPSLRLFPSGAPVRDAAHATRLQRFLLLAQSPLSYRVEVPLPRTTEFAELRAWDAMIFGAGKRTAIELEMRLRDIQALRRRIDLKRRDDPTEAFLLLVADTRHNRRVLAEFSDLFRDLPRLRPSTVRTALRAGLHPPSGLLLV
jgi:transcriptional regulator with XRE-family HTH domain